MRRTIGSVFLFFLLLPNLLWAGLVESTPSDLDLAVSPEHPRPEAPVTITVSSVSIPTDRAEITWTVNGVRVQSGVGVKSITTRTKKAGETMTISVLARTPSGATAQATGTLVAAGVVLISEASTYTPPFFIGKPLPSSESTVTLTAFPTVVVRGARLDPSGLVYTWKKNGKPLASNSGYAKRTLVVTAPKLQGEDRYEVVVTNREETITATDSILVKTHDPEIVFYEDRPLTGTWYPSALGSREHIGEGEFTLRAEPYYFPTRDGIPTNLRTTFTLNGDTVSINEDDPYVLTLTRPDGENGSSRISFQAKHTILSFQEAVRSIVFTF